MCPPPGGAELECAEECSEYMGPGRVYINKQGGRFINERGGTQWAYLECWDECVGKK